MFEYHKHWIIHPLGEKTHVYTIVVSDCIFFDFVWSPKWYGVHLGILSNILSDTIPDMFLCFITNILTFYVTHLQTCYQTCFWHSAWQTYVLFVLSDITFVLKHFVWHSTRHVFWQVYLSSFFDILPGIYSDLLFGSYTIYSDTLSHVWKVLQVRQGQRACDPAIESIKWLCRGAMGYLVKSRDLQWAAGEFFWGGKHRFVRFVSSQRLLEHISMSWKRGALTGLWKTIRLLAKSCRCAMFQI